MPVYAELHDGRRLEFPDGTDPAVVQATVKKMLGQPAQAPAQTQPTSPPSLLEDMKNIGAGAIRGAGSIGATLLTPYDLLVGNTKSIGNPERRQAIDDALETLGANPGSMSYQVGKIAGEVAGTAGVGSALGQLVGRGATAIGPQAAKFAAPAIEALTTSGMKAGGVTGLPGLALRTAAGATTGGASTALINPEDAGLGAAVGATMPGAIQLAGEGGKLIGKGIRAAMPKASPEVAQLAQRAQELGIDLPADRIVNSRPLNAVASSLNYVPLSGRAAVEDKMFGQFNRAVSKTIGQDTDNMAQALRSASKDLGSKFDSVLSKNSVKVDEAFLNDLAEASNRASRELGSDGASIIAKQVDDIVSKAATGEIDGQAAYNIKKTLDRIGNRNTPEAFYARDLKKALMGALNRSLGPEEAQAFAKVRQQYGNMLDLENLVPNGAEGGLSIGRLANMKGIGNSDLQELADIAGTFLKGRESPHGAAQRVVLGGLGATAAGLGSAVPVVAGMTTARAANAALQSDALRKMVLGMPVQSSLQGSEDALQALYRLAPQLAASR